jgi:S-adenosylmethionine decarboxylase
MAFNDALFQLGMDLTRSSTAQTEDHFGSARVAQEDWSGAATDSGDAISAHQKLTIDLVGAKRLETAKSAEQALRVALETARGEAGTIAVRRSQKGCLVGRADFEGGYAAIEAWPLFGYVAFDLVADRSVRPETMLSVLMDAFGAREATVLRGRSPMDGTRYKKPAPMPAQSRRKLVAAAGEKPARARRAA